METHSEGHQRPFCQKSAIWFGVFCLARGENNTGRSFVPARIVYLFTLYCLFHSSGYSKKNSAFVNWTNLLDVSDEATVTL